MEKQKALLWFIPLFFRIFYSCDGDINLPSLETKYKFLGAGYSNSISLTSNGDPRIIYCQVGTDESSIVLATFNGQGWDKEIVKASSEIECIFTNALFIEDEQGNRHVLLMYYAIGEDTNKIVFSYLFSSGINQWIESTHQKEGNDINISLLDIYLDHDNSPVGVYLEHHFDDITRLYSIIVEDEFEETLLGIIPESSFVGSLLNNVQVIRNEDSFCFNEPLVEMTGFYCWDGYIQENIVSPDEYGKVLFFDSELPVNSIAVQRMNFPECQSSGDLCTNIFGGEIQDDIWNLEPIYLPEAGIRWDKMELVYASNVFGSPVILVRDWNVWMYLTSKLVFYRKDENGWKGDLVGNGDDILAYETSMIISNFGHLNLSFTTTELKESSVEDGFLIIEVHSVLKYAKWDGNEWKIEEVN